MLFHQEQYVHDYPFCWRAEEDPLIQYPRESWFIRTTEFKDEMLANNAKINWLPEHIKDGRFGKFLESNVDWALSRERYWGTPLPIWKCERDRQDGSRRQLRRAARQARRHRRPRSGPQAKAKQPRAAGRSRESTSRTSTRSTYDSPFAKGARMQRVPEVIDCWYDSGAMPFAQWGYPHAKGSDERFKSQFPADFISEAIDQTRGWFYSLLAISTLLFGKRSEERGARSENRQLAPSLLAPRPYPHPFRNCIVLGLMLGEDGQKMSKSKRNYREPNEIFDKYGADALRWYFFANQPPWTSIRYSEQAIKDSIPEFLLRLWNVYSFFVIYANIDGFDPRPKEVGVQGSGVREFGCGGVCGGEIVPPREGPQRARSLDPQRAQSHRGGGRRADGRLRQFRRLRPHHRICRCAVELVRPPQPRSLLGRRQAGRRKARRLLDALRMPGDDGEARRPVRAVRGRDVVAESGGRVQGDSAVESVHLCDYPTRRSCRHR